VVYWNYRGHGASERAKSRDYRIRTHADDLARVTDAVMAGGPPPVHVGFSMGVSVVLELYRARPELVSALVFLSGPADAPYANTFPLRIPGVLPAIRAGMRLAMPVVPLFAPLVSAVTRSRVAYPLARRFRIIERTAPREDVLAFTHDFAAMDLYAFWASTTSLMGAHASDVLGTVKVPSLVVGAARDVFVPRSQVKDLARKLPGSSFVMLKKAGHALLIEAGPEVAATVRSFLEGPAVRTAGTR